MEDLRYELDEVSALEGDGVAGPGPPVCLVEGLFGEPPRIVCGYHDLPRDIVGARHDEHACPVFIVRAGVLFLRKDDLSAVYLDVEVLRGFAGALLECLDRVGLVHVAGVLLQRVYQQLPALGLVRVLLGVIADVRCCFPAEA